MYSTVGFSKIEIVENARKVTTIWLEVAYMLVLWRKPHCMLMLKIYKISMCKLNNVFLLYKLG